jgi:predicted phosphodiesterase
MKVLAFSDVHGDTKALKLLARRIEEESFDFMLIAGDLTNADLLPSWGDRLRQMWEVFQVLEGLEIPYYFVWGVPFREFSIAGPLLARRGDKHFKADTVGADIVK